MSDRELMQKIFEALCEGFEGSEFSVSKIGDKVFIAEGDREWALALFVKQPH